MSRTDCSYVVATVDHLGFRPGAHPAERVRYAQGLWRLVRRILSRSHADYLHEECDTVIAVFSDRRSASRVAAEIRSGLEELYPMDQPAGINVSLGSTNGRPPDIDTVVAPRTALDLSFEGQIWTVAKSRPSVTIGRGPDNDIILREETSSREHARIEFRGDHHVLVDCSSNGTVVRDVSGERLVLGGTVRLPRTGIICCSRAYFGGVYPESVLFGV